MALPTNGTPAMTKTAATAINEILFNLPSFLAGISALVVHRDR
jgi:hypothetical protein